MAFINIPQRGFIRCVWPPKDHVLIFKLLLMWGQTDHLLYSRSLFLSICSGLDPDDTNPVFSPLLITYTRTHTHTGVSLTTGRAFVSEKNRRLTCYTVTDTRDVHAHHTHTHAQTTWAFWFNLAHTGTAFLSGSCRGRGGESERPTRQPGRHRRTQRCGGGETNKQMFLMK